MSFRVRPSKFRHVYGDAAKKHSCFENIKISKNAHDTHFACANPKFLAVVTESSGGGSFQVIPVEKVGKIDHDFGKVCGHKGPVLDIKFDPFNDNIIASASEDCTVKIWHIPDSGFREMRESLLTLTGHQKRVVQIEFNPIAEHVLISASADLSIILWDLTKGDVVRVIHEHRDVVCSMGFNLTGSCFATTCRDLQIRLIEPRAAEVVQSAPGHSGTKPSKLAFLTNRDKILTTGFSKYSDRQFAIWDVKNLSKPLKMEVLDSSSGVVFPYYDPDTSMVYLAGRGDGNIRYYEVSDTMPFMHYLSQYQSAAPQRSLCAMPKRGLNVSHCEIFRFYKLYATKNLVEPISMIAPRKSGCFQEDLYPDTAGPTAALTFEDWLDGKEAPPLLISLKAGTVIKTNKPVLYKKEENQLITSDKNNEAKFRFIAQSAGVDYRPLHERSDSSETQQRSSTQQISDKSGSSCSDPSHESPQKQCDGERVSGEKHRWSLQEEGNSYETNEPPSAGGAPTLTRDHSRRSFRKLQRIWSFRQSMHETLRRSPPNSTGENGRPVSSRMSMNFDEAMDQVSETEDECDAASGNSRDKENHNPDRTDPNRATNYDEESMREKSELVELRSLLKERDEEIARLKLELESLRSQKSSRNDCPESCQSVSDVCMSETSVDDFEVV